ncbi:MAG: DNA polymerase I [Deltaproteobacteria bacterium]|nr:DNA polymerase I [Deltaproteobacteria bacterium]
MERVVLVDGSNLVYRAFFALPNSLMTSAGMHTNAIYGFALMFRKIFAGKTPAMGAVTFDVGGSTQRDKLFPEYKATREAMPNDLAAQLPHVHALIEAHGFPILRVAGVEADDVIGTLTRQALDAGHEVHIITSDKDFAQLVNDRVRLVDTLRDVTFDAEVAKKKWGVRPEQMIDYLALCGDSIDNIPGVPGIGDKSATELLDKYGSLDGIYAELDKGEASSIKGRQRKALTEGRASAYLSKQLATIDQHVALDKSLDDLRIVPPEQSALNDLYRRLEFYSLLSEADRDALATSGAETDYGDLDAAWLEGLWRATEAAPAAVVPVFDEEPPAITPVIGLAIARAPGEARWVATGDALFPEVVRWLEDGTRQKVAHDLKELWRGLRRLQPPVTIAGAGFDTRLASFLIDPTKIIPHRLDQATKEYLQRTVRPAKSIIGAGQKLVRFSQVARRDLADWACHLADAVVEMTPALRERIAKEGYDEQLYRHDLPLSYVLGQMELDGILVDRASLDALGVEFRQTLAGYEAEIFRHAGHEFNIGSTKQLGDVLFEELELPVIKKTKTGYSTDAEVLEALAPKHEIAKVLVEHRKLAKLINTYTDVLTRSVYPPTGRIHATFQQTTGATGRLISTDPDLQRTPIHTPEGKRIREAFIAPPGRTLVVADWSQIELRLLAHVTGDERLVESYTLGLDVHRRTAGQIFGVPIEQVTSAQRGVGKTINFATIYGQGPSALAQMLGIASKEAKAYIEAYFKYYAGVRRWLDATTKEALERGWVETMRGRRRMIPELTSNSPMERQAGIRIACNTPIQGSAADLCKEVMLALPERLAAVAPGTKMLLQIHDELVFEAPDAEVEAASKVIKDTMEHLVPLRVPLVAEVGAGRSWGQAKG